MLCGAPASRSGKFRHFLGFLRARASPGVGAGAFSRVLQEHCSADAMKQSAGKRAELLEKKNAIPEILGCGEGLRKGEGAVIFMLGRACSAQEI